MRPMNDKIYRFIDEVKEHPFWLERSKARARILELYRYTKRLEKQLAKLKGTTPDG
jgi:hypothetical protein